jgi:hypothetical protein
MSNEIVIAPADDAHRAIPPEGLCTISPRFGRVVVQVRVLHNKCFLALAR